MSINEPKRMQRGVIVNKNNIRFGKNGMTLDQPMSLEDMYYYSLYWDKFIVPQGGVNFDLPLERDFLNFNLLEKPSRFLPVGKTINLNDENEFFFEETVQEKLAESANHGNIDWIICHHGKEANYHESFSMKQNIIKLKLSNALPIPSVDGKFSIADLVDFKKQRNSELEALHNTMDTLLSNIYKEEIEVIKNRELIRFNNAIKELDKTLIERFKIIKKSDFEVNLSLDSDALSEILKTSMLIGSGVATDGLLTSSNVATAFTTIVSLFSLSKKYGVTFNKYNKNDLKLDYILKAKSANIIK